MNATQTTPTKETTMTETTTTTTATPEELLSDRRDVRTTMAAYAEAGLPAPEDLLARDREIGRLLDRVLDPDALAAARINATAARLADPEGRAWLADVRDALGVHHGVWAGLVARLHAAGLVRLARCDSAGRYDMARQQASELARDMGFGLVVTHHWIRV